MTCPHALLLGFLGGLFAAARFLELTKELLVSKVVWDMVVMLYIVQTLAPKAAQPKPDLRRRETVIFGCVLIREYGRA